MGRVLAAAAALLVTAGAAEARMHAPYRGHRMVPAAALLDGGGSFSTSVAGAYSFRKLKSTYAGPAVRLRRASDNAELDINFLGCTGFTGCPIDTAAAGAHCAATTCFVRTWYDQSGSARDLVNATAAEQLTFVFNCNGSLPCARATGTTVPQLAQAAAFAATSPVSLSAVSRRPSIGAGSPACRWMDQSTGGGNRLATFQAGWYLASSAAFVAVPQPSENVWHAQQGVINGASSVINVDGTETTGNIPVVLTAGPLVIGTAATTGQVCDFAEGVMWSGYGLTPAERAALRANQSSFWGTP